MTTTWNPSDKTSITLSGGNLTATATATGGHVRATGTAYLANNAAGTVPGANWANGVTLTFSWTWGAIAGGGNAGVGWARTDQSGTTYSDNRAFGLFDDDNLYFNGGAPGTFGSPHTTGDVITLRLTNNGDDTVTASRSKNGGSYSSTVVLDMDLGVAILPVFYTDVSGDVATADFSVLDGVSGYTGTIATTLAITSAITAKHGVSGTVGPTLAITSAITAKHGVAGTIGPALALSMSASGTFTPSGYTGTIGATLTIASAITTKHGVSGTSAVTLSIASAITATHGVSGTIGSTLILTMSASGTASAPIATVTGTIGIALGLTASLTGRAGYRWTPTTPDTTTWAAVSPDVTAWTPVSADASVWTPVTPATP